MRWLTLRRPFAPARYVIGSIYKAGFQNVLTATFRPPRPRKTRCWTEGVPTPQGERKWTAATITRLRQRLVGRRQHLGINGSLQNIKSAAKASGELFAKCWIRKVYAGSVSPGFTFRGAPRREKNPVNPGIPVGIVGIVGIV